MYLKLETGFGQDILHKNTADFLQSIAKMTLGPLNEGGKEWGCIVTSNSDT